MSDGEAERLDVVAKREHLVELREAGVALREAAVRVREGALTDEAKRPVALELIREANERLVLALLGAEQAATRAWTEKAQADAARQYAEDDRSALELEAEFRGKLIGILGHDLRNPLMGILMSARLLFDRPDLDPQIAHLLSRIEASAARMKALVGQVLEFTRVKQGAGIVLNARHVNLERLCRNIVAELEIGHGIQGRFHCEFRGDLEGVWDPARIEQVVSNLCGNAIEHGAAGAPIRLTATGAETEMLLAVHNEGPPIPAALLPVLFEPFRQGSQPVGKRGSLGLGLYIASELVLSHGGTIEVHSAEGEGTTFCVHLPRTRPASEPPPPVSS